MFEILSIQADNGDCLFVSYGECDRPRHLLIDGGTTEVIDNLIEVLTAHRSGERLRLEALVVTHYDLDHIQGIIELLRKPPEWLEIADVWFNGRHHLVPRDVLGHEEGTELSKLINDRYPWNAAFGDKVIKTGKRAELPGGMIVSVVSPGDLQLANLRAEWPAGKEPGGEDAAEAARDLLGRKDTWPPGSFMDALLAKNSNDTSAPNGSSIALVLEFDGKRALLTGDAFSSVVADGIRRFWPSGRLDVALFKLSHHGSKRNTDEKLLAGVNCPSYLFSTNGRTHFHPDTALIARVLKHSSKPVLIFNYAGDRMTNWETVPDGWPSYTTDYPRAGEPFVKITL
jgi:beta-lactamase superfamily II metal-dependent hydrolase